MDQASRVILTVARGVLEQLDTEAVLERVLDAARTLTGARYAALGVLDGSRGELGRFLTLGIDEHTRRLIGPLPTGRGVLGELMRSPVPLRIDDVGRHPYSYGFPVDHPPMRSFLGVPILVDGQPYGTLFLTEKQDSAQFRADDEEALVLLADFAGVAIDHARRFSGSENKRAQLQLTVDALDATMQIARALGGETDLQAILELVAKRGRALVAARMLVIELVRDGELELVAGAGEVPDGLLGRRVGLANTVASAALRGGQTQRLTDQLNRDRFDQYGIGHLGLNAKNGLIVPLVFRDRSYGVLVALDHLYGDDFTAEHQRLLEAFAVSAAAAVATAESVADEHARRQLAAAEAERGRWARELHDETLQALGNLRLMLSGARRSGDLDGLATAVDEAVGQLETDIATLRALITELRPAALDQLGLEPALLALVDRVRAGDLDTDAHIELAHGHGDPAARLDSEMETGVYRIVQESLTNAVKHGRARRASVEVLEHEQQITVTVRDDGTGFDPDGSTAGFGLTGMRERAKLLGGELAVHSAPGTGTTVSVSLPAVRRRRPRVPAAAATPPSRSGATHHQP
jgi:signal transduction histidine kinase